MLGNVDDYLTPVSDDDPTGPDLEYDPDRIAIQAAFETSFGDSPGQGADTNWSDVISNIGLQLGRSKDIWLAVYMMRAGAQAGNLGIIRTGAEVLAGLLELYWDTIHPRLDEVGIQGRATPCSSLSKIADFIGPLRRTILVSHARLGQYSGADFERLEQNGDVEPDYGMFRAAMNEIPTEDLGAAVECLNAIKSALKRVDAVFDAQAGNEGPNFQETYQALDQMRHAVAVYAGPSEVPEDVGTDSDMGHNPGTETANPTRLEVGRIDSRDDVIRALDSIAEYYRRKEPSSPVPTVLQRARQWVTLDFLSILEDIAPGSLDDAKQVLVFKRESDDS